MIDLIGQCENVNEKINDITREIMKSYSGERGIYDKEIQDLLSMIIKLSNSLSLKQLYIMAIFKQEQINNLTNEQEKQKLSEDYWKKNNMNKLFSFQLVDIEDLLEEEFSFKDMEQCIQKVIDYNNKFIDIAEKMCEEFDIKVCL